MTVVRPPQSHAERGRAVENAGAWVGTGFFAAFGVVELVLRLGIVKTPGPAIPASVLWLFAACFLPKGASVATKGGIWKLLYRGKS